MLLRVAADTEAEVRVALLQKRDELAAVAQAALGHGKFGGALRRVAAERHDVPKAVGVDPVGNLVQLVPRMTDACQVGHHGVAVLGLQEIAHLGRPLARASACAVRHRREIRGHGLERGRGL
jgi:hypothetical protein